MGSEMCIRDRFDDAAERNKCMRIKILGDCYYCVSGVPLQDEDHAYHSVQMGLDMITLIQVISRKLFSSLYI